jgi:hypothetical protein
MPLAPPVGRRSRRARRNNLRHLNRAVACRALFALFSTAYLFFMQMKRLDNTILLSLAPHEFDVLGGAVGKAIALLSMRADEGFHARLNLPRAEAKELFSRFSRIRSDGGQMRGDVQMSLSRDEIGFVVRCINEVANTPSIPDWEFSILLGQPRAVHRQVLHELIDHAFASDC